MGIEILAPAVAGRRYAAESAEDRDEIIVVGKPALFGDFRQSKTFIFFK